MVVRGEILMWPVLGGIFLTCLFDSVYERGRLLVLMGGWMQMVVMVVGSGNLNFLDYDLSAKYGKSFVPANAVQ